MSTASTLLYLASFPFLSFVEIFVGCLLFAWYQPRRDAFGLRLFGVFVAFALLALAFSWLVVSQGMFGQVGMNQMPESASEIVLETIGFSLFLVAMLPALMFCFDTGPWSALFCAMAGYTLQNFGSGLGELALLVSGITRSPLPPSSVGLLSLLGCAVSFLFMWRISASHRSYSNLDTLTNPSLLPLLLVVFLAVIGFDVVLKSSAFNAVSPGVAIMTRIFHGIFCLFTLFAESEMVVRRQMAIEVATTERLMAEHERQLQLSQETIDAINLKCHDLRHQIRHLADGGVTVDADVLAEAARDVNVYDCAVHTGNRALDTILTEKRLLAEQAHVTLTCIADGEALSFIAPVDLYAFFGNALDNALEAVERIDDPDRRSISLMVRQRAGMALVHVENTCTSSVELVDGLPQTTKLGADGSPDTTSHGFGTRSMRAIVESYGGTLTYTPTTETFSLDAMIPLPVS